MLYTLIWSRSQAPDPPHELRRSFGIHLRHDVAHPKASPIWSPLSRVLVVQHDIEELKRVITHRAMTIQILEKKGSLQA